MMGDCDREDALCQRQERALRAILARVDGVWDDKDLVSFGPMETFVEDIKRIAKSGLGKKP